MRHPPGGLGPEFWSSPVVASALACSDFAVLLGEIRNAQGWTQAELAQVVGYSQSWVSRVLRKRQPLTLEQAREIARRAGIPVHLLRLSDQGGEVPAKRRDFAAAVTLAVMPWPKLPQVQEEGAAAALTAITAAQRRLDASTPARDLARGAAAHVDLATRMAGHAWGSESGAAAASALSEAAGFAGWLCADMCDHGTARTYYRLAVSAGRRARHDLLAGYMLGSLAAFEIGSGDHVSGLGLIEQARQQVGGATHPTPQAWLACLEALGHTTAQEDQRAAEAALDRAGEAITGKDAMTQPPWPWMFAFDDTKLAGYRALVYVRLGRTADALAAFGESLGGVQPAPKQRAVIMLEVATAVCQDGSGDRDTARVDEAFRLAVSALEAGAQYGSERVVERSRQFRFDYTGPVTPQVREFDHRMLAALL